MQALAGLERLPARVIGLGLRPEHARPPRAPTRGSEPRRVASPGAAPSPPAPSSPMLAKRVAELPEGPEWIFEPKWDGFRVLVFRDGDELLLQSRDEKPLDRYFPDLRARSCAQLPERCVLDGEIVIAQGGALDFEALQLRIHPAASRVALLAKESPASVVFFDALCEGDRNLRALPFRERRRALERLLARVRAPLHLTPAHRGPPRRRRLVPALRGRGARRRRGQAGLGHLPAEQARDAEGASTSASATASSRASAGTRAARAARSARCSSASTTTPGVLHHVGVAASFTDAKRRSSSRPSRPTARTRSRATRGRTGPRRRGGHRGGQRMPGAQSRWSRGKDLSWEPLRPELVVRGRLRPHAGHALPPHARTSGAGARTSRRATARTRSSEVVPPHELAAIFAAGR